MRLILGVSLAASVSMSATLAAQIPRGDGHVHRVLSEIARTSAAFERGPTAFEECSLVRVLGDSVVDELRGRTEMTRPSKRSGAECVVGKFDATRILMEFVRGPDKTVVRTEYISLQGNVYEEYELVQRGGAIFVLMRKQWGFVERH